MPGDWMLGLEWPTCSIDHQKCPSYFSRCDLCDKGRISDEKTKELESGMCTDK